MPVYIYWGEDEYALHHAVKILRDRTLDPAWASFNEDKILADQANAPFQALTQAMTPPFGSGQRFIWLVDSPVLHQCPGEVLVELERTLPNVLETSTLLFTSRTKPDARLKSTKLLQQYAKVQEFSPVPPWKLDQLIKKVQQAAQDIGVPLTHDGMEFLAEAVGNNTRQLYTELEKLRCFAGQSRQALGADQISQLVTITTQTSLKLADAIRQGHTAEALELVADLLGNNEPTPVIVATLVGRFRTWLWVKLLGAMGERDDRTIAQAAEISNPKRLYFLQQEVRSLSLTQLQQTLPILLNLEVALKRGANADITLQTAIIQLCYSLQGQVTITKR